MDSPFLLLRVTQFPIPETRSFTWNGLNIRSDILQCVHISSRGTKKSQFRSYRRRKAKNAPETKKSQQTALSRKKASLRPPKRRKASFTCLRRKKASLRRPRMKNYNKRHFARKNTNKKHLRDYPWYQLHLNLCGWVLWNDTKPVL